MTTALMQQASIQELHVDGIKVRYATAGEGPVVLLIHGLATSMITWCRNMGAIADAGFTAVALDLPATAVLDLLITAATLLRVLPTSWWNLPANWASTAFRL